jgi:putative PIN family toxin of toxin-antitoxin system
MSQKKDRIIIDTNLWISFLLSKEFGRLDKIFKDDNIIILFSEELLEEFLIVASRPKFNKYFSQEDLSVLLREIERKVEFIKVTSIVEICRDPKDNFLFSLALDGNATHLISGDKDILSLTKPGQTTIITMADYLKIIT